MPDQTITVDPFPVQGDLLADKARVKVILAPRRVGKTMGCLFIVAEKFIEMIDAGKPGMIFWLTPVVGRTGLVPWMRLKTWFRPDGAMAKYKPRVNEQEHYIECTAENGEKSRITVVPAVKGGHSRTEGIYIHLLVIDEAGHENYFGGNHYNSMFPATIDSDGDIVVIGLPPEDKGDGVGRLENQEGWFRELWNEAEKDDTGFYKTYRWFTLRDNPMYGGEDGFEPTRILAYADMKEDERHAFIKSEAKRNMRAAMVWRRVEQLIARDKIEEARRQFEGEWLAPALSTVSEEAKAFIEGCLEEGQKCIVNMDTGEITPSSRGSLTVWEDVLPQYAYAIGADSAYGVGGHYSVAHVIRRPLKEEGAKGLDALPQQVAMWRSNTGANPSEFGRIIHRLALRYNNAMIVPEREEPGMATILKILDLSKDVNCFMFSWTDHSTKFLDGNQRLHAEIGWDTNSHTRPLMLTNFLDKITNRGIVIRSSVLYDEIRRFDWTLRTKKKGGVDDTVLAFAAVLQAIQWVPIEQAQPQDYQHEYIEALMAEGGAGEEDDF